MSAISTTVGIALTSNPARASIPGNVLLRRGEANLPKTSVVNVTQILTIDKSDLKGKIGHLRTDRLLEVLRGLRLVTEPRQLQPPVAPIRE